jgi:phage terminase large subunit GpA-like protein
MMTVSYASTNEIRRRVAEYARPPARISVSDAAVKVLRMEIPGGYKGPWRRDLVPYMALPMDLLAARDKEGVVFIGPAQTGKTFAFVGGALAHTVEFDPADMLLIHMSQDTARDFSRKELDRWIRHSPKLRARMSRRPRDDNTFDKFFSHGAVLKIGWPAITQLSGKSVRVAIATDYDRAPDDIDGEGELFGLLRKRVTAFMSRGICAAEGSPGRTVKNPKWRPKTPHEAPPCDGLLKIYNQGDRRRWYWPCPDCGEYFEASPGVGLFALPKEELLLEMLRTSEPDELADRYSHVVCPHCGAQFDEGSKAEMNRRGVWVTEGQSVLRGGTIVGEPKQSNIASLWMGGVAAAFISWRDLVLRHMQALKAYLETGDQTALKTTENTDQGLPHTPRGARIDDGLTDLQLRGEDWPREQVPVGVRFLIAVVDVQRGRFVIEVHGFGVGLEEWIVDRYALKSSERLNDAGELEPLDPATYTEDWDRLVEKVLDRRYELADGSGRTMPVHFAMVDSGGEDGVTNRAYEFWRRQNKLGRGNRFRLLKGFKPDPKAKKPPPRVEETLPDARGRKDRKSTAAADVPLILVNTLVIKDAVWGNVMRSVVGPGYVHFPKWLGGDYYAELTAESRTARGWEKPPGARNEAFDLAVYARAATILLGAEKINWDQPPLWAADWDKNPAIRVTAVLPVARQQPRVAQKRKKLRASRSTYIG